jgi:predicted lactoylglutathione lyase
MVKKAVAAGGKHAMDPQDHGFMYGWSYYDIDGHNWEVFWMDPKAVVILLSAPPPDRRPV